MKPKKASIYLLSNTVAIATTTSLPLQTTTTNRDFLDFGPYNHFVVKNNSGQPVIVYVDGDTNRGYRVESGECILTDADDNIFFKLLTIYNAGPNPVAIGEINVTYVRKVPYQEVIY